MEVFITNLESRSTVEDLKQWLNLLLDALSIHVYHVHKAKRKTHAILTVPDRFKAEKLIDLARSHVAVPRHPSTGRTATFAPSRNGPDKFLLKHLHQREYEESARKANPTAFKVATRLAASDQQLPAGLDVALIQCGRWEAKTNTIAFVPFQQLSGHGTLSRSGQALRVKMETVGDASRVTLAFEFTNIRNIQVVSSQTESNITLSLAVAPKIFKEATDAFSTLLGSLGFDSDETKIFREGTFLETDTSSSGTCFVYKLQLTTQHSVGSLRRRVANMVPRHMSIVSGRFTIQQLHTDLFSAQATKVMDIARARKFDFAIRFQIEALWTNAILSPKEVLDLIPAMAAIFESKGTAGLSAALHFLHVHLATTGPLVQPLTTGLEGASRLLAKWTEVTDIGNSIRALNHEILIHRALVTPAGIYLYGPDKEAPNRVVRQYPGFEDCFLRVMFSDETGDKIQFNSEYSNDHILRGRFLSILQEGITVGGEKFDFLGFSHSSLRSQSCWFMRQFSYDGITLTARGVIQHIGHFADIRCPAKCAARIGQAFTDTQRAIKINPKHVSTVPDVIRGRYVFTDGCGTISQHTCTKLRSRNHTGPMPTLYQIRYKGAKGMISLDTALHGPKMCLRESMIKFNGSPLDDIEICGVNTRPLPLRLNRPLIKILEDLKVPFDAFHCLQTKEVNNLRRSAQNARSAIEFLSHHLSDSALDISDLAEALRSMEIDMVEDNFIRDVLRALIELRLRELKFRTRILVEEGLTLYGISDETGLLEKGEVFVTFQGKDGEKLCLTQQTIAVTRSPALHPGDVQIAKAIMPPSTSRLRSLTNCIVFSQKGDRDLPSMLGGGDLDGDLFNIIYDRSLVPRKSSQPAEYTKPKPVDIGREVTADDMTRFFIDFMESDQLGRLASLHQVYADQEPEGTFSATCIQLAELSSCAVDFSKTGIPVDIKQIPRSRSTRPDFMAPSTNTRIERNREAAEAEAELKRYESGRYCYYESDKTLGKLFRAINEDEFFDDLEENETSIFGRDGTGNVMEQIWEFVQRSASHLHWKSYYAIAQDVRDYYNSMVTEIMDQYTIGDNPPLSEKEIIIGSIIGRSGVGNARQREYSEMMKSKYQREIQVTRQWMKEQTEHDSDGYLCLAIACLSLCVGARTQTSLQVMDNIQSFGWFAATICVPRLTRGLEDGMGGLSLS